MDIDSIMKSLTPIVVEYGLKLIGAIAFWIIGAYIVKLIIKFFGKALDKRDTDASLKPFLLSLTKKLLYVALVISIMAMLGVEMTSFIAILGAAGLAVGMALSGTLQNFAGGVMILLFKPFKVGDLIEAQGYLGVVKEIQIFNTIMKTPDNKTIIIPNGTLSNASMVNYSTEEIRRIDLSLGIGYGDDVEKAREILNDIAKSDKRILTDPAPFIGLTEMGDSSVNLTYRVWAKGDDYWAVYFDTNEKVYNEFNKQGINIPFPQMDVHLFKQD
jgi:small conductance mechanosensitive channel